MFASSNTAHGEVYSIQHYVIKFINDLRQDGVFFLSRTPVSSANNTCRHDITEILLKVALSIITLTLESSSKIININTVN
jgi:hypothetical protein